MSKAKRIRKAKKTDPIGRRLAIVTAYVIIVVLSIEVLATKSLSITFDFSDSKKTEEAKCEVSKDANLTASPKASASPKATQSKENLVKVQNGDSYYTITKRHCGSGKMYNSVAELNNSVPLYEGDSVKVFCEFPVAK